MRKALTRYNLIVLGLGLLIFAGCGSEGASISPPISPPISATTVPGATVQTSQAAPVSRAVLPSPSPAIIKSATATTPTPNTTTVTTSGLVFALLADNRLLTLRASDGAKVSEQRLAPAPPPTTSRSPGQFMALSKDGKTLYCLIPGWTDEVDRVGVIEVASARLKTVYSLARSQGKLSGIGFSNNVYRSLVVGPKTGRLYLFGNRFGTVIITVLDPTNGTELASWTGRERDGHNWLVYQGAVSEDERQLYVSYHGDDTSGIDRFEVKDDTLERCQQVRQSWGCLGAHGSFAFYENELLVTYGYNVIVGQDQAGVAKRGFDTGLSGSHVTEFVVDNQAGKLYAINTCLAPEAARGGFSVVDLRSAAMPNLATLPGEQQWPANPPPPKGLNAPSATRQAVPCGERLALGSNSVMVAAKLTVPPYIIQANSPGAVLFIDTNTGQITRSVDTSAVPLDVLAT